MTEKITPEDLDALPVGSVVLDRDGDVWQRRDADAWCSYETAPMGSRSLMKWAPLTLLHRPDAPAPSAEDRACDHAESLHGRCTRCGMTWEQQAAARQPAPVDAETTTEWGIRHELAGIDVEDDDGEPFTEEMAREYIEDYHGAVLVSRQITPWREVPRG